MSTRIASFPKHSHFPLHAPRQPNASKDPDNSQGQTALASNILRQNRDEMRSEAHKPEPVKRASFTSLVRVNLLQPGATFVQGSVDSCGDGERAADNGAYADQEAGEGL